MSFLSEDMRRVFKQGDDVRDAGLTTPDDITRYDDIQYGDNKEWQVLDVYKPKGKEKEVLPVIVSVHGGAWVYGDKERYQYYCMSLAQRGFAVVNFTYLLAPEHKFPAAIEDANLVFGWIIENKDKYGFDTENIFAVGDSAGAHQLSIYAVLCTNEEYAKNFEFKAPNTLNLKGLGLNCGAYSIQVQQDKEDLTTQLMAEYLPKGGTKEEIEIINVVNHINSKFPPTFIMTAVGDFLVNDAPLLASKLVEVKVPFRFGYYGDPENELGHVFHCNMKLEDAKKCNDDECNYFKSLIN